MGINSSSVSLGNVGLENHSDEKLVQLKDGLYDESILNEICFLTKYEAPRPTQTVAMDYPGSIFNRDGREILERRSSTSLMEDITRLTDADSATMAFRIWLHKQQHVIREAFLAMRKETVRVKKRKADMIKRLKAHIEQTSPKLSIGASLGLSVLTQMFLRTAKIINMVGEKYYLFYIEDSLATMENLLTNVPPLALKDSREFSQDVCKSLYGLYDFILDLLVNKSEGKSSSPLPLSKRSPRDLQILAVKTMFRAALATGSVADLLAIANAMMANVIAGTASEYPIKEFLKFLSEYNPDSGKEGFKKFAGRQVTILTNSGKYVSVEGDGRVVLSSSDLKENCSFEVALMGKHVAFKSSRNGGSWLSFTKDGISLSSSCGKEQKLVMSPYSDGDEDENDSEDAKSFFIFKTTRGTALWANDSEIKQVPCKGLEFHGPVVFKVQVKEDEVPEWIDGGDGKDASAFGLSEAQNSDLTLTLDPIDAKKRFTKAIFDAPSDDSMGSVAAVDSSDPRSQVSESNAISVIMVALDRLSGTESIAGGGAGLAVVSKPFCIKVAARTFTFFHRLLEQVTPAYFDPSLVEDDVYLERMYVIISTLRVLKAHLYQLVRSKLPLKYFDIQASDAENIKRFIFRFVKEKAAPRSPEMERKVSVVTAIVQAEAAEVFAEGFEFFFRAVSDQVTYLAGLLRKRVDAKELSKAEQRLFELLLKRFASFESGALLMDELEGKGVAAGRKHQASLDAVKDTLNLLLQVGASEITTILDDKKSSPLNPAVLSKAPETPVVQILTNLQKHLISRASQWKILSIEEESKQKKMALAKQQHKNEPWRTAYDALRDYSQSLFEFCCKVMSKAIVVLKSSPSLQTIHSIALVIQKSIVGQLGRPLVTLLTMFSDVKRSKFCASLLPSLSKFVVQVDKFLSLMEKIPGSQNRVPTLKEKVFESKHPYAKKRSVLERVTIHNANSFFIHFDPRCETESADDSLQFFAKNDEKTSLTAKFYGPPIISKESKDQKETKSSQSGSEGGVDQKREEKKGDSGAENDAKDDAKGGEDSIWPKEPVLIKQKQCFMRWRTSDGGQGWGFRIIARGTVMERPAEWLRHFGKNVAWLCGSFAATLVHETPLETSEERCQSMLEMSIFKEGFEDVLPMLQASPDDIGVDLYTSITRLTESFKHLSQLKDMDPKKLLSMHESVFRGMSQAAESKDSKEPVDKSMNNLLSGANGQFLISIIKGEGLGSQLVTKLRTTLKVPECIMKSVRPIAARLVRYLFAAILKHTASTKAAMEFAQDERKAPPTPELKKAFKYAVRMQYEAQQAKAKGGTDGLDRFEKDVMIKINFLFGIRANDHSPSEAAGENASNLAHAVMARSAAGASAGDTDGDNPEMPPQIPSLSRNPSTWTRAKTLTNKLKNTMRALRAMVTLRTSKAKSEEGESKIMEGLMRVIQMRTAMLPSLNHAMVSQRTRAIGRLLGLQYFSYLCSELTSATMLSEYIQHLSFALRQRRLPTDSHDSVSKVHFLSLLDVCGEPIKDAIRDTYYSIIAGVSTKKNLSQETWILLVDLCNVECTVEDLVYLSRVGIIPVIRQSLVESLLGLVGKDVKCLEIVRQNPFYRNTLSEGKDPTLFEDQLVSNIGGGIHRRQWNVRAASWALTRLLTYFCSEYVAREKSAKGEHMNPQHARVVKIQSTLFELMFEQIKTLQSLRRSYDAMQAASEMKAKEGKELKDSKETKIMAGDRSENKLLEGKGENKGAEEKTLEKFWSDNSGGINIVPEDATDDEGIIFYLGTRGPEKKPYTNAMRLKEIEVICPFIAIGKGGDVSDVVARKEFTYKTVQTAKPYVTLDFKVHQVMPSAYRLMFSAKAKESKGFKPLTSWKLCGSSDGEEWETLDTQTNSDVFKVKTSFTFKISPPPKVPYNRIKLVCLEDKVEFLLPGIELFGTLDPIYESSMKFEIEEQLDWWQLAGNQYLWRKSQNDSKKKPAQIYMDRSTRSWAIARGARVYKEGSHLIEVMCNEVDTTQNARGIEIGLVNPTKINCGTSSHLGRSQIGAWCYIGGSSQLQGPGRQRHAVSMRLSSGTKVGLKFNIDKGTLEFIVGNRKLAKSFKDVKPPVCLAVSAYSGARVTILKQKLTSSIGGSQSSVQNVSPTVWIARSKGASLINSSVHWYSHTKDDVGFLGKPALPLNPPLPAEIDSFSNQLLWVMLRCSTSPSVKDILTTQKWTDTLLNLTRASSSKIRQMLSIRILRSSLPSIEPTDANGVLKGKGKELLLQFLERIGYAFLWQRGMGTVQGKGHRESHPDTELSISSELGSLIRTIMTTEHWKPLVNSILRDHLGHLQNIGGLLMDDIESPSEGGGTSGPEVKEEKDSKEDAGGKDRLKDPKTLEILARIVGCLNVLSGHKEPHREGARVIMESDGEVLSGTVVQVFRKQAGGDDNTEKKKPKKKEEVDNYNIHFDNGDDFVTTDVGCIDFVPDVLLPVENLIAFQKSLDDMSKFINDTSETGKVSGVSTSGQISSSALLQHIRAQVLKALCCLAQHQAFGQQLLLNGFGKVLHNLALSHCETFGDFKHNTIYNLENLSLKLSKVHEEMERAREEKQWTWTYDGKQIDEGDKQGILYFIGTRRYTEKWTNPCSHGLVNVTSSSLETDSKPPSSVVGRSAVRCVSRNQAGQYFIIDLKSVQVKPTHYTLRHYSSANQEALRNWNLLGSNDGLSWDTLMTHSEDTALSKKGQCYTWRIPEADKYYRMFKVLQTGPNSNKTMYLALSGFELYGSIFENMKIVKRPKHPDEGDSVDDLDEMDESDGRGGGSGWGYQGDEVWAWGTSSQNMLGTGNTAEPLAVGIPPEVFEGHNIVQISCFYLTVIALTEAGRVFTWGYGYYGSCGHGNNVNCVKPTMVKGLEEFRVIQVGSGEGFTCALTEEGRLYTMGDGSYGQHGDGTSAQKHSPNLVGGQLADKKIIRVGTGGYHLVVQTDQQEVYSWGYNYYRQLGLNVENNNTVMTPTKSQVLSDHELEWTQWAGGYFHTMALDSAGHLYTWGTYNTTTYPVCGHGDGTPTPMPKRVEFFEGQVVVRITAGLYNSFCTTSQGHAYAWGRNQHFCCGLGDEGTTGGVNIPSRPIGLEEERVLMVDGGNSHAVCICESGNAYAWGYGNSGQLGQGSDNSHKKAPVKVAEASDKGWQWSFCVASYSVTFLIRSTKKLKVPSRPIPFPMGFGGGSIEGELPPYPAAAFLCGSSEDFFQGQTLQLKDYVREEMGGNGLPLTCVCTNNTVSHESISEDERSLQLSPEVGLSTSLSAGKWLEESQILQPEGQSVCLLNATVSASLRLPKADEKNSGLGATEEKKKKGKKAGESKDPSKAKTGVAAAQTDGSRDSADLANAMDVDRDSSEGKGKHGSRERSISACSIATPVPGPDNSWVAASIRLHSSLQIPILQVAVHGGDGKVKVFRAELSSKKPFGHNGEFVHLCLVSDAENATVRGFINGLEAGKIEFAGATTPLSKTVNVSEFKDVDELVGTLKGDGAASARAGVTFVKGLQGYVRDLGIWRNALSDEHAKSARQGFSFVADDYKEDMDRKDQVQYLDLNLDDHKLPKEVSLFSATSKFEQVKHFDVKNKEGVEWCLALPDQGYARVARTVHLKKRKIHNWTFVMDMMINKLPDVQQALLNCDVECATAANVYISNDGRMKALGKGGGRKMANIKPMMWHRVVVTAKLQSDVKKSELRVYVDGKPALMIKGDEQLKSGGRYSLDTDFYISGDSNDKHKLAINVRRIQLWPTCLKPDFIISLGGALQPLLDAIQPKDLIGSLLLMGHPRHWCLRAIDEAGQSRRKASDWILCHKDQLVAEDKKSKHEEQCFNLSLIGFPVSWCSEALQATGDDPEKALLWLLRNEDTLRIKDSQKSPEQVQLEAEKDKKALRAGLRYSTEKSVSKDKLYRLLKNTSEPLDIELATLIKREPAERVTSFDSTSNLSGIRMVLRLDDRLHKTLCIMHARKAILTLFQHWPKELPLKLDFFGPLEFVGKFMRLVDFSRFSDGLELLRKPLIKLMQSERKAIDSMDNANSAEQKQLSAINCKTFSESAPLSQYLVSQGLHHLVTMCCNSALNVDSTISEKKCLECYNASLVVWINNCFIELVDNDGLGKYGRAVLSKRVVNLIFKSIAVLKGKLRLSFVQLLTTLIRRNVEYDVESCNLLKDLLNRLYSEQSVQGSYSSFFQALLELLLIIEEQQGRIEASSPTSKVSVTADAKTTASASPPNQPRLPAVAAKTHHSLNFTYESDLDRNGIIYHIGSRAKTDRWENPGEFGYVSLSYSSMDAKCMADDFEVFNRDPYAIGFITDASDVAPVFTIDLHQRMIVPSHYTLRHAAPDGVNALRNWRLEASDDGRLWVPLRIHVNDKSLDARGSAHTWPITLNPTLSGPFSMFRVVGVGPNSSDNSVLCLSGFEIYGKLTEPVLAPLTINIFDASDDLEFSADGENWVKSVGGEPVKKAKAGKDKGGNSSKGGMEVIPNINGDPRPTIAQSTKKRIAVCKTVQSFSEGKHYFEFRIIRLPGSNPKVRKTGAKTKKPKKQISVGVVPKGFNVSGSKKSAGSQGGWAYTNIGTKVHDDKSSSYASPFKEGDVVGLELDLDSKSIHFFKNDVSQGIAFTDVEGHGTYHPVISLHTEKCKVQLNGVIKKPKTKMPENWPWFNQVIDTGRLMQSFVNRETSLPPYKFLSKLCKLVEKQGIGSAERALPKGLREDEIDMKTRLPKSEVEDLRAYLEDEKDRMRGNRKGKLINFMGDAKTAEGEKGDEGHDDSTVKKNTLQCGSPFVLRITSSDVGFTTGKVSLFFCPDATPDMKHLGHIPWYSVDLTLEDSVEVEWDKEHTPNSPGLYKFQFIPISVEGQSEGKAKPILSSAFKFTPPKNMVIPKGMFHLLHDAKQFSLPADAQIVACVDRICDKKNLSASIQKFPPSKFEPGPHLIHYKLIEACKTSDLQVRVLTLQLLNEQISALLPMLNFSVKPGMSPLTDSVRALRTLIFWSTKSNLWQNALTLTQTSSSFGTVNINRFKSNKLRDRGKCDTTGKRSCFGQLFRQLNKRDVTSFRIAKGQRAWRTKFLGEGGIDAGGLYRELIYCLCMELQSKQLPLFILCPNGREQIGQNRDKWVPNPSATSPLYLAMYEFLGKLMGLAIRTLSLLNLDLPSIVWKALIGAPIEIQDVVDIDRLSFKLIENMKSMEPKTVIMPKDSTKDSLPYGSSLRITGDVAIQGVRKGMQIIAIEGQDVSSPKEAFEAISQAVEKSKPWSVTFAGRVTPEQFNMAFVETKFVIVGSDQKERQLVPGGANKTLQWENRKEFCDHILDYRKNEFKEQCAAMRRGLACVVPYALLSLFTWNELEAQVCGRSQMNVDLLQKMTKYQGCSASDRHIQFFWQIMRNRFDEFEKAKFLKFVWGRARLPVRAADFQTHFTINALPASNRNPDAFMPIGHTCFFSVDIPAYTNLNIMHKRLLYAITHCEAIDADYGPRSIQAVQDDDSDDE